MKNLWSNLTETQMFWGCIIASVILGMVISWLFIPHKVVEVKTVTEVVTVSHTTGRVTGGTTTVNPGGQIVNQGGTLDFQGSTTTNSKTQVTEKGCPRWKVGMGLGALFPDPTWIVSADGNIGRILFVDISARLMVESESIASYIPARFGAGIGWVF